MQLNLPPETANRLALLAAEAGFESVERFAIDALQQLAEDANALVENVAAVNASIADLKNGERGTPAGEDSQELRNELGCE